MAKKWYVLHTYSGYENKVKSNLEQRIEAMGLENNVFGIEIPTEMVTEIKEGGRRVESEKKVFPGYVLVRMELDDRSWAAVRNTPGVTGFVGSQGNDFRGYARCGQGQGHGLHLRPRDPRRAFLRPGGQDLILQAL